MRRILVGSIAVAVALTVAISVGAQSSPKGIAPALTISHWQVTVSDLKKSQEFYARLLGATVIDTSPTTWTLKIPTASQWLSLTKAQGTDPATGLSSKPGMFELGVGIDLTPKNAEQVRLAKLHLADATRPLRHCSPDHSLEPTCGSSRRVR